MRWNRLVCLPLLLTAGCGTMIRVVDSRGEPVQGAEVRLIKRFVSPFIDETKRHWRATTDADGYVRLWDGWFWGGSEGGMWNPLRGHSLQSDTLGVEIKAGEETWLFRYPPPEVARLSPAGKHFVPTRLRDWAQSQARER